MRILKFSVTHWSFTAKMHWRSFDLSAYFETGKFKNVSIHWSTSGILKTCVGMQEQKCSAISYLDLFHYSVLMLKECSLGFCIVHPPLTIFCPLLSLLVSLCYATTKQPWAIQFCFYFTCKVCSILPRFSPSQGIICYIANRFPSSLRNLLNDHRIWLCT